jgi:integral membrane protein
VPSVTTHERRVVSIGRLEGVSFLVLLAIAMPLKYAAGEPMAVRIVGAIHGALFIAYVAVVWWTGRSAGWPRRWTIEGFVASVVPFGVFWFERRFALRQPATPPK